MGIVKIYNVLGGFYIDYITTILHKILHNLSCYLHIFLCNFTYSYIITPSDILINFGQVDATIGSWVTITIVLPD